MHAEPGESIGLVGANGSGKSTLLRILSRVMYPDGGSMAMGGRVGALIEVTAGIHPQLTGRENVYLYGSLLGLARKEVTRRFDPIIDFADVGGAVDRLVKHYSSGMKMRLGFAVAAFLEPDILLVDEVLAVGDASFQQRCLDRMRDVLAQGTTLIFVSHDLAAVEATCERGLWLDGGVVKKTGFIGDVMSSYRRAIEEQAETLTRRTGVLDLCKIDTTGPDGGIARAHQPLEIHAVFQTEISGSFKIYWGVSEGTSSPIFSIRRELSFEPGETEVRCVIRDIPLPRGRYYLWLAVRQGRMEGLPWHPVAQFEVSGPDLDPAPSAIVRMAPVHVESSWETSRI